MFPDSLGNIKRHLIKTDLFSILGNEEAAKLLIQNGSDINNKEVNGRTPVFLAAEQGMFEDKFKRICITHCI